MRRSSVSVFYGLLVLGIATTLTQARPSDKLVFQIGANEPLDNAPEASWSGIQNDDEDREEHSVVKQLTGSHFRPFESPAAIGHPCHRHKRPNTSSSLQYLREVIRSLFGGLTVTSYRTVIPVDWRAPHHPPPGGRPIDLREYTIWEILNWTLHHPPEKYGHGHSSLPLFRLAKLVNFSVPIQDLLADPKADLTFFAPDDVALTPPSKRHHHGPGHSPWSPYEPINGETVAIRPEDGAEHPFWQAMEAMEHHLQTSLVKAGELALSDESADDHHKEIFLHIIELVLKYHVSPGLKSLEQIISQSTLPTSLRIEHKDDAPAFRVRVGVKPPFQAPFGQIDLNFFTKIGGHHGPVTVLAKNGVIHIARGVPLLPPFTPLTQLFLFPTPFSTLTSALQKVHLDDLLLPHFPRQSLEQLATRQAQEMMRRVFTSLLGESEQDSGIERKSFTIFAPTNKAFRKLGFRLNAFLFSPFGARVLRYVLSYHVVPDIIWYTDHTDNSSSATHNAAEYEDWANNGLRHPDFASGMLYPRQTLVELPTLLGSGKNESLSLKVIQLPRIGRGPVVRKVLIEPATRPKDSKIPPAKPIPVLVTDAVAWGGAVHVIPRVIRPPVPEKHCKKHKDFSQAAALGLFS